MRASFKKIASNLFCLLLIFHFSSIFAQTLNLKDFEKMATAKSAREYLEKKDFTVKQDSSSGKDNIKLKLVNKATHEIVHLSSVNGSEGDKTFDLEYFTESQEEYAKIIHTVVKSGYNPVRDERHYEKRTGTDETHNLVLRGATNVKGWDYFSIRYIYTGKVPAEPIAPAKK